MIMDLTIKRSVNKFVLNPVRLGKFSLFHLQQQFISIAYKTQLTCFLLILFVSRVLHPEYRTPYLKLWSSFYANRYRVDHVQDAAKAAEIQALKLENEYKVSNTL